MEHLDDIVKSLDSEFNIEAFGKDPAFSRFIPSVYKGRLDWKALFEPSFNEIFNGLMIKGDGKVKNLFLAVFPTSHVLNHFIDYGEPGDLLFMHHPLVMECGDPYGKWGRGFVPIEEHLLHRVKEKGLSIHTCHVPMDYHQTLGTSQAMAESLGLRITNRFIHDEEHGDIGIIGEVTPMATESLINQCKRVFDIPYVDFEGKSHDSITKVAVVAGCGDKVKWMKEAEKQGVEAYISGEIHCHIDNDYGRKKYQAVEEFVETSNMSLIGVSHAASEYLVKRTLMYQWFEMNFDISLKLIPQEKWWL